MSQLTISIEATKWAVFDGWQCIKEFAPHSSQEAALEDGKSWCAAKGCADPEVVYPVITKMTTTRRKVR